MRWVIIDSSGTLINDGHQQEIYFVNRTIVLHRANASLVKLRELLGLRLQKSMQHDKGIGYYKTKKLSKGLLNSNKT